VAESRSRPSEQQEALPPKLQYMKKDIDRQKKVIWPVESQRIITVPPVPFSPLKEPSIESLTHPSGGRL
jgi:hypothetical protein